MCFRFPGIGRRRCPAWGTWVPRGGRRDGRTTAEAEVESPWPRPICSLPPEMFSFAFDMTLTVSLYDWQWPTRGSPKCQYTLGPSFLFQLYNLASSTLYTVCRSLVHLGFVNVLWHLFRKCLWAGGLNYSCHPAKASSILSTGNWNKASLKPTERVIDIWCSRRAFQGKTKDCATSDRWPDSHAVLSANIELVWPSWPEWPIRSRSQREETEATFFFLNLGTSALGWWAELQLPSSQGK